MKFFRKLVTGVGILAAALTLFSYSKIDNLEKNTSTSNQTTYEKVNSFLDKKRIAHENKVSDPKRVALLVGEEHDKASATLYVDFVRNNAPALGLNKVFLESVLFESSKGGDPCWEVGQIYQYGGLKDYKSFLEKDNTGYYGLKKIQGIDTIGLERADLVQKSVLLGDLNKLFFRIYSLEKKDPAMAERFDQLAKLLYGENYQISLPEKIEKKDLGKHDLRARIFEDWKKTVYGEVNLYAANTIAHNLVGGDVALVRMGDTHFRPKNSADPSIGSFPSIEDLLGLEGISTVYINYKDLKR